MWDILSNLELKFNGRTMKEVEYHTQMKDNQNSNFVQIEEAYFFHIEIIIKIEGKKFSL